MDLTPTGARLGTREADDAGIPSHTVVGVARAFTEADEAGLGALDRTAIARLDQRDG
jgi:hypothetical protein